MPKAFPPEFRRDVVVVARKREAPISQIAKDFGISEACLHRWLKLADIEDGVRPGATAADNAELRELKKRNRTPRARERDPASRGCVLRSRDPPKMMYPLVLDLAGDGIPHFSPTFSPRISPATPTPTTRAAWSSRVKTARRCAAPTSADASGSPRSRRRSYRPRRRSTRCGTRPRVG
jgi:transposase